MYKKALQLKLRFHTNRGYLSAEQLWDLSFKDLSETIKAAKKVLTESSEDGLDFLEDTAVVNEEDQLTFDILKDVYITKRAAKDAINDAAKIKEHNEKILAKIYEKQEASLGEKTVEELTAMLK